MGRASAEERFAQRVKFEREYRRWSQAELATRLGVQLGQKVYPTTIAKIESRASDRPRSIRLDEAAAIAEVFEIPLGDLIGSTKEREPDEVVRVVANTALQVAKEVDAARDKLSAAMAAFPGPHAVVEYLMEFQAADKARFDRFVAQAAVCEYARYQFVRATGEGMQALVRIANIDYMSDEELDIAVKDSYEALDEATRVGITADAGHLGDVMVSFTQKSPDTEASE